MMNYNKLFCVLVGFLLFSTIVNAQIYREDLIESGDWLTGNTQCLWGSRDCNPCVSDVVNNFENISDNNGDHTDHIGWGGDNS